MSCTIKGPGLLSPTDMQPSPNVSEEGVILRLEVVWLPKATFRVSLLLVKIILFPTARRWSNFQRRRFVEPAHFEKAGYGD